MILHHARYGNGPPLLLIHGTGSYGQVWEPVVPRLAREREVIVVDLPGFGVSPPLPDRTRPNERSFADALTSFLDRLGVEAPHVAGNSLGGGIALELGALGRARSVTGLSPTGFWTDREAAFTRASLKLTATSAAALGSALYPVLRNRVGRTLLYGQMLARPWRMPADAAVRATQNIVSSPATRPAIESLGDRFAGEIPATVPVTIAWGAGDRLMFPRQGRRGADQIPHARFVELRGCGHVPMTDDPELVARTLLEGSTE